MFNVVTDTKYLILAVMISLLSLNSCSGSGDKAKAQALLDSATEAFQNGDYTKALELTDSLRSAYPSEIDIRREALHLSTRATEGLTLKRLETADSLLAVLGVRGDSLSRLVRFVENPIEGYYVAGNVKDGNIVGSNGLQARLSPSGDFYMISSLKAKQVKSTSVTVECNGERATTSTIAHDGERNDRSMGAEIITFMAPECDTVAVFIAKHVNQPMTLTFNGASAYKMPLPKVQAQNIATLYDYAVTLRRAKLASLEKEKLTRAIDISRAQAAKTFVEKTEDEE